MEDWVTKWAKDSRDRMAWRASYSALLEIFPQVDARIIKGAALDHGDDVGSAADFILNEVLGPEEGRLDQEQEIYTTERLPLSDPTTPLFTSSGPVARDEQIFHAGNISNADSRILIFEKSGSTNENFGNVTKDGSGSGQGGIAGLARTCSSKTLGGSVGSKEEVEAVRPVMSGESSECNCGNVDSRPLDVQKIEAPPQLFPEGEPEGKHISRIDVDASSSEYVLSNVSEDELAVQRSGELNKVEAEMIGDEMCDFTVMCVSEAANAQGFLEEIEKEEESDKVKEIYESRCVGSTYTDPENSNMEDSTLGDQAELEDDRTRGSVYDSVLVSGSNSEEIIVVGNGMDQMMVSTKISFDEEDDTEGGCWETVSNTSTQMASMETLLDAVEQAKADKEVLISSIEELRDLRQQTDQAEYAARLAKDEAAKGGLDIMAKVDEMKQMLSRSREANEMHAAEVHGEKAVLATEARELRSRIVQLKTEKENALFVLNEIKASLQTRINKACQEREAAIAEKAAKEALARECLAKEEALMAQVVKESKDLQAETETCNTLREFFIERGNIVDALQGEVAVLCEDAEELKEEIERMSLSCSSGFVHMLKPRPLSDSNNSSLSRSSKSLGDRRAHFLEGGSQLDLPPPLEEDFAANYPARSLVAGQRNVSDKRLPSLRRALSGSQDLSGSSHSSVSSNAGASNSGVSSRSVAKLSADISDGSKLAEDKYSSPRSSQCSSETERKLYEAHIAMFPDEESALLDYRTNNLDIFRTESLRTAKGVRGGSSDEDGWHLLDMTVGSKNTSSGSSSSSYAEK